MDFALPSIIVIIFLLIPGVIFRRVYFQGGFSSQFDSKSWSHSLFFSFVFGLFIEILSFSIYSKTHNDFVSFDILDFFQCIKEGQIPSWFFNLNNCFCLLYYLGFTFIISFTLGSFLHHLVRALKLDVNTSYLRFNNYWYYFFKGEINNFEEFNHLPSGDFAFTNVDVMVNMGDGTTRLYSGNLVQHNISNVTGELENIYLIDPERYNKDKTTGITTKKGIPGDCLIIPKSQIINFNLKYYRVENSYSLSKNFINVLLILGYFFIWLDISSLIDGYGLLWKLKMKTLLHLDWWVLVLLMSILFKKPKDDETKETIKYMKWFVLFLLVLTIFSTFY